MSLRACAGAVQLEARLSSITFPSFGSVPGARKETLQRNFVSSRTDWAISAANASEASPTTLELQRPLILSHLTRDEESRLSNGSMAQRGSERIVATPRPGVDRRLR